MHFADAIRPCQKQHVEVIFFSYKARPRGSKRKSSFNHSDVKSEINDSVAESDVKPPKPKKTKKSNHSIDDEKDFKVSN
jgi:hypothetical protein